MTVLDEQEPDDQPAIAAELGKSRCDLSGGHWNNFFALLVTNK
ncbi:MAG: hypothetical protein WBZ19_20065 [Chthoniobacterales bacterium]